jgi:hypothetical protein
MRFTMFGIAPRIAAFEIFGCEDVRLAQFLA